MSQQPTSPQMLLKQAQDLVKQTASRLHDTLAEMAGSLIPFPYFMGSLEVQAVEAEPGGVRKAERGCIVVCADGEMYEFTMKVESTGGDFGLDRTDKVERVDLPPEEYIVYAYNAIKEMAALLEEQKARAKKYSF